MASGGPGWSSEPLPRGGIGRSLRGGPFPLLTAPYGPLPAALASVGDNGAPAGIAPAGEANVCG